MPHLKTILELCRVSNLPTVWTNVLAAAVLSGGDPPLSAVPLLAIALSCFYMAGMSLNDICDIGEDRSARPSRPLPAGRISVTAAWQVTAALFILGFALLTLAPRPEGIWGGGVLLASIVFYDVRHRDAPSSVLVMASCRFLVFAVTSLTLTGSMNGVVVAAGFAQFLYVLQISFTARSKLSSVPVLGLPLIPAMLAGISVLDGVMLAILDHPLWLAAGFLGAGLTWRAQRLVRGD